MLFEWQLWERKAIIWGSEDYFIYVSWLAKYLCFMTKIASSLFLVTLTYMIDVWVTSGVTLKYLVYCPFLSYLGPGDSDQVGKSGLTRSRSRKFSRDVLFHLSRQYQQTNGTSSRPKQSSKKPFKRARVGHRRPKLIVCILYGTSGVSYL